jgi:hypothetical protein
LTFSREPQASAFFPARARLRLAAKAMLINKWTHLA